MSSKAWPVDQRADQRAGFERIADGDGAVGLLQPRHQRVVDALVDEQAAQRRAALAGRAHGGEGNAAQRQVEIGRRADDRRIVAAEFEDGAGETLRQARADGAAHGRRAGGRNQRDLRMVDQHFADLAAADAAASTDWPVRYRLGDEALQRLFEQRLHGKRRQRRLFRRLPDGGIAADQRQRGIPRPDGDREVEGGDDADHAERMPGFHHPVLGALGGDRQAVELARQADGEIADVDHLLHFAQAFRGDLADLDRNEPAERGLGGAQFLAEQADQFAALRRRHGTPFEEGLMRRFDRRLRLGNGMFPEFADFLAGDRRGDGKRAAVIAAGIDAEFGKQLGGFGGEIEDGDGHCRVSNLIILRSVIASQKRASAKWAT